MTGSSDRVLSFDVDDTGRCSGEVVEAGVRYRFVTTADDRMLVAPLESQQGRWVEIPDYPLAAYCSGGPQDAALSIVHGRGRGWLFADLTRVGIEQVAAGPVAPEPDVDSGVAAG